MTDKHTTSTHYAAADVTVIADSVGASNNARRALDAARLALVSCSDAGRRVELRASIARFEDVVERNARFDAANAADFAARVAKEADENASRADVDVAMGGATGAHLDRVLGRLADRVAAARRFDERVVAREQADAVAAVAYYGGREAAARKVRTLADRVGLLGAEIARAESRLADTRNELATLEAALLATA